MLIEGIRILGLVVRVWPGFGAVLGRVPAGVFVGALPRVDPVAVEEGEEARWR